MTGLYLSAETLNPYIEGVITEFLNKTLTADDAYLFASAMLAETPMAAGHLLQQATFYLEIQALGAIPFMIFTSTIFVLRVEGKANFAMMFNLTALLVNIGLDFILVNLLHGNMIGAAMATVTAQSVAA